MKNLIVIGIGVLGLAALTTMAHDHEVIAVIDQVQPQLKGFEEIPFMYEGIELSVALPEVTNVTAAVITSDQAIQSEAKGEVPYRHHLRPPPLLYPLKQIGKTKSTSSRVSSHLRTWRGNERSFIFEV